MTRKTGQPSVALAPAGAALQPISGESRIVNSAIWELIDVPPGAMTRAAEIDGSAGIQIARIGDHSWVSDTRAGSRHMGSSRPMAAFA